MANRKSYWEKLQDPRWQKRKTEILEREDFICERCGDTEETLHIHHSFYPPDTDPWDVADWHLHCYCKRCHKIIQKDENDVKWAISFVHIDDLKQINGFLRGWVKAREKLLGHDSLMDEAGEEEYSDWGYNAEELCGFVKALFTATDDVMKSVLEALKGKQSSVIGARRIMREEIKGMK